MMPRRRVRVREEEIRPPSSGVNSTSGEVDGTKIALSQGFKKIVIGTGRVIRALQKVQ